MIVGNGMVAKEFFNCSHDHYIIFASGVSNSNEQNTSEFDREILLLKNAIKKYPKKTLIYFSTCSIYDNSLNNSKYVLHKEQLEKYISENIQKYYIFRLSHVVGNTSNNTVINFIYKSIKNTSEFNLWKNSYRNLIDISDVKKIVCYIVRNNLLLNSTINIASPYNTSIENIVWEMETILNKKGKYKIINMESNYNIDISIIIPILKKLNISINTDYFKKVIRKYYNDKE